jgi:hypothetical protein
MATTGPLADCLQGDKSDLISGGNPAEWSAVGDVWGGLSENMEYRRIWEKSSHSGKLNHEQPRISKNTL